MKDSGEMKKILIRSLPYVFLFWVFSKAGGAYRLSAGTDMVTKMAGALAGLGAYITRNPLPSLNIQDLSVGILGAAAIRAAVYFKGKNAKKYRPGVEYGSARWGA
ncbi:MAG: conjugal transfer protein TraG [Lachnospiraceae bacterium]|nr:conjugal transfer protein TraG [Lachnospiraceae bacterium]